jgi:AmmeMemoRadiSam system protein B
MASVRPPAVAGTFYPGDAAALRAAVNGYLGDEAAGDAAAPKALIAPHAGYVYSGATAGAAYRRLRPARATIRCVVLIGPAHRVPVDGVAVSGAEAFATPLGSVAVDAAGVARALDQPGAAVNDAAHHQEHSLEVQLPFLQTVLDDFSIVPLVVGRGDTARVLDALWGGPETLVVVSSDLSHYLGYDEAREIDAATCAAILALDGAAITPDRACGRAGVNGLLRVAASRGLAPETVALCNSGDTAGPRDRVVGYGAWVFQ